MTDAPQLDPVGLEVVRRLSGLIPPEKLGLILGRLADRLEALAKAGQGADLVLHVRVHRGRFNEARWNPDERIG